MKRVKAGLALWDLDKDYHIDQRTMMTLVMTEWPDSVAVSDWEKLSLEALVAEQDQANNE